MSVGVGFGVPLVLRNILGFGTDTEEAIAVLERMPIHMSYNVTVLDCSGKFIAAYLRPETIWKLGFKAFEEGSRTISFGAVGTDHTDEVAAGSGAGGPDASGPHAFIGPIT